MSEGWGTLHYIKLKQAVVDETFTSHEVQLDTAWLGL
jgi:hypothetical protein